MNLRIDEIDNRLTDRQRERAAILDTLHPIRNERQAIDESVEELLGTQAVRREDRRRALAEADNQLMDGFSRDEGCLPDIAHLRGTRGLTAIESEIAALKAERARLVALLAEDPRSTKPFRLLAREKADGTREAKLKVWWPDADFGRRRLVPGDVVRLTPAQARQWHDAFEPVSEAVAQREEAEQKDLRDAWRAQRDADEIAAWEGAPQS